MHTTYAYLTSLLLAFALIFTFGGSLQAADFSEKLHSESDVRHFIDSNPQHFGATDAQRLSLSRAKQDASGKRHYLYQQNYQGVPVYGQYLNVHLNDENEIYTVTDRFDPDINQASIETEPELSETDAIRIFEKEIETETGDDIQPGGTFGSLNIDEPEAKLVIYPDENRYVLAYQVALDYVRPQVGSWVGFVDAGSGSVLHKIDNRKDAAMGSGSGYHEDRNLNVHQASDGEYYLFDKTKTMFDGNPVDMNTYYDSGPQGVVATLDYSDYDAWINENRNLKPISDESGHFTDAEAVDAHYWTGEVYDFYWENYGRNSIDDNGMDMTSFVHTEQSLDNAYWSIGAVWYGEGDVLFDCLACSSDVVMHEITHGVTQYSTGLNYSYQSGALEESIADIMAAVFDTEDAWTIGEETSDVPLRNMAEPNNGLNWQPEHMDEYLYISEDNGGVHYNSGIPNHAAYTIATELDAQGYDGKAILGDLTYTVLTNYLFPSAQFMDARNAFITAVGDLSLNSTKKKEVRQIIAGAWSDVGVELNVRTNDAYVDTSQSSLRIDFNDTVTQSVYYDDISMTHGDQIIPHTKQLGQNRLTLEPKQALTNSVTYDVYMPAHAVKDSKGYALKESRTVSFTVDTASPTWNDDALSVTDKTETSVKLQWDAATDNQKIESYEIVQGQTKVDTVSADVYSYEVLLLDPGTEYTFTVTARDAAGNVSDDNPQIAVTTNESGNGSSGGNGGGGSSGGGGGGFGSSSGEETEPYVPDMEQILEEIESGEDAEVVISAPAETQGDLTMELTYDIFEEASENNKVIHIQTGDAAFSFEPDTLALDPSEVGDGAVQINVKDVSEDAASLSHLPEEGNVVSDVWDFELTVDGQSIHEFNKPVRGTLQVHSNSGYDANKLGVYTFNEENQHWEYVGGDDTSADTIEYETDHFSNYVVMEWNKTFSDIQQHWAQYDIEVMAAKHLVNGVSDDVFAPNENITRAEFTTLIVRALQLREDTDNIPAFADVKKGTWYRDAVRQAHAAGIVSGMDEKNFVPDLPVTREQMALMLIRAYTKEKDVDVQDMAEPTKFSDEAQFSSWADEYIDLVSSLGLMNGRDDGSFDPKSETTRAEATTVIRRLLELVR